MNGSTVTQANLRIIIKTSSINKIAFQIYNMVGNQLLAILPSRVLIAPDTIQELMRKSKNLQEIKWVE